MSLFKNREQRDFVELPIQDGGAYIYSHRSDVPIEDIVSNAQKLVEAHSSNGLTAPFRGIIAAWALDHQIRIDYGPQSDDSTQERAPLHVIQVAEALISTNPDTLNTTT